MPHIHTEPGQHDHTVSIYIFRTDFDQSKVLLHLHRKVGFYAQFGGHIELDETPWQSVMHELEEETGYKLQQLQLLQPRERMRTMSGAVIHPYPVVHSTMPYPNNDGHFHTDSAYALVTTQAPRHAPAEGESQDLQLFTQEEVKIHKNIDTVTRDIALYIFRECLLKWTKTSISDFQ